MPLHIAHSLQGSPFFFQAEVGIRAAQESRGLGDVYKRQVSSHIRLSGRGEPPSAVAGMLSLIHI